MDLLAFRKSCGEGSDEELVRAVYTLDPTVQNPDQARIFLWAMVEKLLSSERYGAAGLLLWGSELFNNEPRAVRQLFQAVRTSQNLIVLGAAAMGKSYSLIVFTLLDWLRDPQYTECKIISTTGGHAKSQAFSTLQRLYKASIVPLPGIAMDQFVGLDPKDSHTAIKLVAIPQGEDGKGVLQGFHPVPRPSPHPVFGSMSRVRAFLDECEEIPAGVWEGVANLLASGFGTEHVKVYCATNPRDVTSKLSTLAEPSKGWVQLDLNTDKSWRSLENWDVIRLDGYDSENVQERRLVYGGFLTWEGYTRFATEMGGNSPRYLTFARGSYPLTELQNVLIPYSLLEGAIGTFIFSGRTIGCAAVDLAFEGDDRVVLFVGKYGNAIGFTPLHGGKPTLFQKSRYTLQAEQFYELKKERTIALATSIEARCKGLQVNEASWVCVDRTGVGTGVHDALHEQWSGSIKGIMWGGEAGNRKILSDDSDFAVEICDGIATEMHLRIRKFLEFGFLAISPQIDTTQLFRQLSSRRYQPSSKGPSGKPRIKLEIKREFKKRMGSSPDHGDALAMLCHICALNGPEKARFGSDRAPRFRTGDNIGPRERTAYIDFSQDL